MTTMGFVRLGLLLCFCLLVRGDTFYYYDTNGTVSVAPTTSPIDNYYYFYSYYYNSDVAITLQSVQLYSGEFIQVSLYDTYYNVLSSTNLTGYVPTKVISAENAYFAFVNIHFSNLNFNWSLSYTWTPHAQPTYNYIYDASGVIAPNATTSELDAYYYFSAPYGGSYGSLQLTFGSLSLLPSEYISVYSWWGESGSTLVANLTGYVYYQTITVNTSDYATVHLDFRNLSGSWSFSYSWVNSDPVPSCSNYISDASNTVYTSGPCWYYFSAPSSSYDLLTISFYGTYLQAGESIKVYSDWYMYNLVADLTYTYPSYVYQSISVNSTTYASLYISASSSSSFSYTWTSTAPTCYVYVYDQSGTVYPTEATTDCIYYFLVPSTGYYDSIEFDFSGTYLDSYQDYLEVFNSWSTDYPWYTFTSTVYQPVDISTSYYAAVKVHFDSPRSYWSFTYNWKSSYPVPSPSPSYCSQTFYGLSGSIAAPVDPYNPSYYAANADCNYYLSPSSYYYVYTLQITLSGIQLEDGYDYINIRDSQGNLQYQFTGQIDYQVVTLYDLYSYVEFVSDSSVQYSAFYIYYSYQYDDYSSSSSSNSSSSGGDGSGIIFVIALIAFLLGCVLGLIVAIWLSTRSKSKAAQPPVDIPLQSQPLLGASPQLMPQTFPYPPPMQEQFFNPSVMGLGLPQGSYVQSQGMQVPIQMPFYSVIGAPASVPASPAQQQQKSTQ